MNADAIWFRLPPPAAVIPAPPPEPAPVMVALTIDGRSVEAPAGATLLDACKTLGIDIPTLCYLETLTPVNACRVCMVEVEGARVLAPACSRKVEAGMVVKTRSPRVDLSRKVVLELLGSSVDLSTAPGLAEMMVEYGARPERFQESLNSASSVSSVAPVSVSSVAQPVKVDNELYVRDYGKCVLCYKCVEACGTDAQNTFAIAVAGRGFAAHISTEHDVPLPDSACVYCGNCIAVCPTGALMATPEFELRQAGEWRPETQAVTDTICAYCGVGCTLTVHVQDQQIVKVTSPFDNDVTRGNLCVKGRFGFEYVNRTDQE
ncbi:MAG: 2Fe-2S iron-sulfur cluster-binding protein [Vicinamibacterales bacterium]|jgi:predicted molibdopterin-dependent oxidoreductase YjgC